MNLLKQLGVTYLVVALLSAVMVAVPASASVSLFLEEPFGTFGAFNPTGHAAVYLSGICADTPTHLRLCQADEQGVVISRYHRIGGYDWIAIPLIPYLYAVDDLADVPEKITPALSAELRDDYRRAHLLEIAPNLSGGTAPKGEWIQLVGSSYDRHIYAFQVATSREQDSALIARLNDGPNKSHFNLFYRNCADFSRSVLRTLYPDAIPPNSLADFGLTTPKHLARSLMKVGREREELDFRVFQIPQVPGTTRRSHHVDGIAESLVRSKKYIVPLALLSPTTAATLVAAYVGTGRFSVPKHASTLPELVAQPADLIVARQRIAVDISTDARSLLLPVCSVAEANRTPELFGGAD